MFYRSPRVQAGYDAVREVLQELLELARLLVLGFVCAPDVDVHDLLLTNEVVELRMEPGLGSLLLVVLLLNIGLGHGSILLQLHLP